MKRYIFFIMISCIFITCFAPSKKKNAQIKFTTEQHSLLQEKIDEISKLILNKPFHFNAHQNISQQYLQWCKKLSREEMIKIIAHQEETERGFTHQDAQVTIKELSSKPLSEIHDIFMKYQRKFVVNDIPATQSRNTSDRIKDLHLQYQDEQSNLFFRKIPIVHNIESMLLPLDITQLTDQELYEKIEQEMNRIGFSKKNIQEEMHNLKNNGTVALQKQYPHLLDELSKRLSYFNSSKKDSSSYIQHADYYLNLLHTWTSTVAFVLAHGASLVGFNPSALHMIANTIVLNSYISQSQEISKRQMLAMIYAQYKNYDDLQDFYLDPYFKKIQLLTKSEILNQIRNHMETIKIPSDSISVQMRKYDTLKKSELEIIAQEFEDLSKNYQHLSMSQQEKKIAGYTKQDLLDEIDNRLLGLVSKKEQQDIIKHLQEENINFARTTLLDLMQYSQDYEAKMAHEKPSFSNYKENFLLKSPKIISDTVGSYVLENLQKNWAAERKSRAYRYWKTRALQQSLKEKHATILEDQVRQIYKGGSLMRSMVQV